MYTDLKDETLKEAVICPKTMLKFLKAAILCLNLHSEGGTSDVENPTNDGRYFSIYHLDLCFFLSFFFIMS